MVYLSKKILKIPEFYQQLSIEDLLFLIRSHPKSLNSLMNPDLKKIYLEGIKNSDFNQPHFSQFIFSEFVALDYQHFHQIELYQFDLEVFLFALMQILFFVFQQESV